MRDTCCQSPADGGSGCAGERAWDEAPRLKNDATKSGSKREMGFRVNMTFHLHKEA